MTKSGPAGFSYLIVACAHPSSLCLSSGNDIPCNVEQLARNSHCAISAQVKAFLGHIKLLVYVLPVHSHCTGGGRIESFGSSIPRIAWGQIHFETVAGKSPQERFDCKYLETKWINK